MDAKSALPGAAMALAAAMLWGTTGTAQSLIATPVSPYWVGALRLAAAGVFFVLALGVLRRHGAQTDGGAQQYRVRDTVLVLFGGACVALYNLAFFAGVRATGIAVGTAVAIGSGPLWAGLLEASANRRAPRAAWWAGTLVAVAGGVAMVLAQGGSHWHVDGHGLVLCLVAGLAYAAYALATKSLVARHAPAVVTAGVFGLAALLALPAAWLVAGPPALDARAWLVIVYLGVVATGVSYLFYSHALTRISAATSVALALFEPVTAAVLAVAVAGEAAHAGLFAGLALVLGGLALVLRAELRGASTTTAPTANAVPPMMDRARTDATSRA